MFKLVLICFIASFIWGVIFHEDGLEVKYGKDMARSSQSDAEAMFIRAMWLNQDE
tara:strand:- start:679 stop:843 length:165 start_codon:yes stop_codon:yes gene_type:complete